MDYTELFSKAIDRNGHYDFKAVRKLIDAHKDYHCGDWDEWADDLWYMLTPSAASGSSFACYGYICAEYPVALLTESCPQGLADILGELGVLSATLDEPMLFQSRC